MKENKFDFICLFMLIHQIDSTKKLYSTIVRGKNYFTKVIIFLFLLFFSSLNIRENQSSGRYLIRIWIKKRHTRYTKKCFDTLHGKCRKNKKLSKTTKYFVIQSFLFYDHYVSQSTYDYSVLCYHHCSNYNNKYLIGNH